MLIKPFGTPWSFPYKPQVGGEYVTPSGNPSIHIFENRPSEVAARNGSGALATVSAWTYSATTNTATFTVPAINDPQDGTKRKKYWIAINFTVSGGSQAQLDLRSFTLALPDGMDEDPVPTATELKQFDTLLDDEYTDPELTAFIQNAERSVKRKLKWSGFGWPQIENPGELKEALVYRALMYIYLDLADQPADVWMKKFEAAKEEYTMIMTGIVLIVDRDDSGMVEEDEEQKGPKILSLIV